MTIIFKNTYAHFTQLIIVFRAKSTDFCFTQQAKQRQFSTLNLFQLTDMYIIISL